MWNIGPESGLMQWLEDAPIGIFVDIGNFVLVGPLKVIGPSVVMEFCILLLSSSFPFLYIYLCTYSPNGTAVLGTLHSTIQACFIKKR